MYVLAKDSGIWQWAMFSFVLAGITGFLYRLGFIMPIPFDLNLENIRHAHSHLMFFGWASLLPLYLIKLDYVPRISRGIWGATHEIFVMGRVDIRPALFSFLFVFRL